MTVWLLLWLSFDGFWFQTPAEYPTQAACERAGFAAKNGPGSSFRVSYLCVEAPRE